MKKKKRAASRTLGCLFWAALVVVLVAVALAVREPVLRNVRNVFGVQDRRRHGGSGSPGGTSHTAGGTPPAQPSASPPAAPATRRPPRRLPHRPPRLPRRTTAAPPLPHRPPLYRPLPHPRRPPRPGPSRTRTTRLWFVKVDTEGAIELAPVNRSLAVGDSPLRDNLDVPARGSHRRRDHRRPRLADPRRHRGALRHGEGRHSPRSTSASSSGSTRSASRGCGHSCARWSGPPPSSPRWAWSRCSIEGKRVDYLAPEGAAVGSPLGRDSDFQ